MITEQISKTKLSITTLLVTVTLSADFAGAQNQIEPKVSREGEFYIYTFDESRALVSTQNDYKAGGWSIDCRIDQMNDKRLCRVFQAEYGGINLIYFYSESPKLVCIFGKKYPHRKGQIRVDKHDAVDTDARGCVSPSLVLDALVKGSSVLTRAHYWPKDEPVDVRSPLKGLNKALEIVDRIRAQ